MGAHRIPPHHLRRAGLGVALGALLAAGIVDAQPTAPTAPLAPEAAPAPAGPAAEEAPPATVAAPAPAAAAPVEAKDVAPAVAPKEQVAEKPVAAPIRRNRYDIAVIQALDKVTAETLRFEARVNTPVRWKGLVFTVRACERSAPDEPIEDSIVYLTIDAQPRPQPGRPTPAPKQAFKGWMFAASPGLNPVQHATYDAWAISCRASAPVVAAAAPRATPAPKAVTEAPKVLDLPAASGSPAAVSSATPAPKVTPPAAPTPAPKSEPAPKADAAAPPTT
ncbi:DUF2155 domain-containing protein [Phenylobacterium sp.]|uniref:DUF2155 domain-containing protein n=1 Tax=Phenylobacterium sp. TaxID=1871053 RepID=UPI003D2D9B3D